MRHENMTHRCDTCSEWPAWWLDLATRIEQLEILMSVNFEGINAAADKITTVVGEAVTAIQNASSPDDQAAADSVAQKLNDAIAPLQAALDALNPPASEAPADPTA